MSLSLAEALKELSTEDPKEKSKDKNEPCMPTVRQVASDAAMIYAGSSLTDAMDTMESAGHSSAVMVGDDGSVKGILTENDILKAYCEKVSSEFDVEEWVKSERARVPTNLLPMLTVEPAMPLVDAAAKMAVQRQTHYACHHLLVEGGTLGHHHILSALDITMALCTGDLKMDSLGKEVVVADAMKKKDMVPTCQGSDCIKTAFESLHKTGQNLALVSDQEGGFVYGVITPRDALRAFGEHVPEGTTVRGWLRGLQATLEPRRVDANTPLLEAAQVMVSNSLHHLCVVEPGTSDVVGVLSCLDIVCRIGEKHLGKASPPPGMLEPAKENMEELKLDQPALQLRSLKEDCHPAWQ